MSTSITTSFVKQYEREVHEAFQRRGSFLLQTIRRKTGVKGSSTHFQVIGTGIATTKARHGTITPMNQSHTSVECTLEDFYAGDWVDKLDEAKVNHDEREAIAHGGAWALGRKADEQIVTKMDGTSTFVGDHSTGITRALLLGAVEALNDNDVPNDGQRFGLLGPRTWSTAMTIAEFADADFIGGDNLPYLKGAEPRTWLGVHWMVHTGIPGKGTATAKNLVYHKSAVGYASGAEITADITWHGDRAAHFVNHYMSGGACLIDANGVVEIRLDETAAIPI
ncbi:MAG: phage capsid protein [Rhodospirillales bacterium]